MPYAPKCEKQEGEREILLWLRIRGSTSPSPIRLYGVILINHRDNFAFPLLSYKTYLLQIKTSSFLFIFAKFFFVWIARLHII
jgi:hypothetical protein